MNTGRPKADYTGQRRGKLLIEKAIIEPDSYRNRWGLWLCKCDCGNVVEVVGEYIKSRTKESCGCLKVEAAKAWKRKRSYATVTITAQYGAHRRMARERNCEPLSKSTWLTVVEKPCVYCGDIDKRNVATTNDYKKYSGPNLTDEERLMCEKSINGVDRVDSSKGYTVDNSVSCCARCNWMKSNQSVSDFVNKAEQIHTYTTYNNIKLSSFLCN